MNRPGTSFIRSFGSWALALRNASSPGKSLQLYSKMQRDGFPFDSFCIVFTLKSCAHLQNLAIIRHLHAHIVKLGCSSHVYVATSLLKAYVVVSFLDACLLFDEMPDRNTVTWNTMITGYSRSGDIQSARSVFEQMPHRDTASWSAIIAAYTRIGSFEQGLSLFRRMMGVEGIKPSHITAGSVLSGCSHLGSLGILVGKSIHGFIVKNGWESNLQLGTILVNMYAKCGFLKSAAKVFVLVQERNVMAWTALICGSAKNGYSKEALAIFEKMQIAGVQPNELTFTGVLTACAQIGLVNEGRKYFKMIEENNLQPRIQHYGCLVHLLGKAGMIEEAYEIIRTMKLEPNIAVWGSFLSACKQHRQFEMADRVIKQVLGMVKPENDGGLYSLKSDLYVLVEKWEEAERLRELMLNANVPKTKSFSFVRSGL